jgi:hypothetical protein
VNGNEVSSCSPNNKLATTDDNCNSVNSDCDGRFDDHYQDAFEPCGFGACNKVKRLLGSVDHIPHEEMADHGFVA